MRTESVHVSRRVVPAVVGVAMLAATLAGCSTQSGSVSPGGGGPAGTHDVPVAIAGDCSRDVTGAIQAWIGSVGDGSVLRFAPNACYRIDGTLRLDGRNNLTLEGNNATFKAGTDGGRISVDLGSMTEVKQVTIQTGRHPYPF